MTYGCYDRAPFAPEQVLHGIDSKTGQQIVTRVPFRNSPDCNYTHTDLGQADPGCVGCKHRVTNEMRQVP